MKAKTNFYWEQTHHQQVIVVPTRTIVDTCLGFIFEKKVQEIPISVLNRNQPQKSLQRHPIFINDSDHDCIIDKILC